MRTVQLPESMAQEIKKMISEHRELEYVSIEGFVEDAVRRHLKAIAR